MAQGLKRDKVLAICGINKNKFYYKPNGGKPQRDKPGRNPSSHTLRLTDGKNVKQSNPEYSGVSDYMKSLFDNPMNDYGFHRMVGALQLAGFYINHKKVYRLMKAARLLRPTQPKTPKEYMKYKVVWPEGPLRLMEIDNKQVWVEGLRPPVGGYALTILDVFTRCALHWEE